MQSPKLQLYNKVFELIEGYDQLVVDYKDMTNEWPYPFFVLSDVQERKILDTFNSFSGELTLHIHLWSLADDKSKHDELETRLNRDLSFLDQLEDYQLIFEDLSTNTLIDNTTNQLLLHTVMSVAYKVYQ